MPGSLPAAIPVRREVPGAEAGAFGDRWWILIPAFGALLAGGVFAARRAQARGAAPAGWRLHGRSDARPARAVERIASLRLTPRHSLQVIAWDGRRLLLACTEQGLEVLAQAAAAPTTATAAAPGERT